MVVKNIGITVVLLVTACQSMAMKRQSELVDLSSRPTKCRKVEISLQQAVSENSVDLFKQGISCKANVNEKDASGNPLFFTILDKIDALRQQNLQNAINQKGHDIIAQNNKTVEGLYGCLALILKEDSFDANCSNSCGIFSLCFLGERETRKVNIKAAKMFLKTTDEKFIFLGLLKAGANPNMKNMRGDSVLHCIINADLFDTRSRKKKLIMVDTLINYGAHVNELNRFGKTPLHYCYNDARMVPLLLSHNACFNHKDSHNMMPFDYSGNYFVQDMLENEKMVEKVKSDLELFKKEVILDVSQQSSMNQLLSNRQAGLKKFKPIENLHVKAVVEYTKKLTSEVIMHAMARHYQLAIETDED